MLEPDNKSAPVETPEEQGSQMESAPESHFGAVGVIEMSAPDGHPYRVSDEAEAAHFHRAFGYRFMDSADRDRILPNH